jgi:hypothetical protein
VTVTRLAAVLAVSAALASTASANAAPARLPGVETLVSASVKGRTATLVSPRVRTRSSHALVLAFVVARGGATDEGVSKLSGDRLRWSRVARSDGPTGAVEVWRARARHRLSGRIVARLASAAYPASIVVVAYRGSSPYVSKHASAKGRGSTPRIKLRPTAGSLVWTVGLSEGQHTPVLVSSTARRRVVLRRFDQRHGTGAWIEMTPARSAAVASAAGAEPSRTWNLASVDVVVPGLKRMIEEGLTSSGATLPGYCPPSPAFEVGVQDDPVFLGLQPAMTPTRGFELATDTFHSRLLRLNVIWGQVKQLGWAPYDRAVKMARERCWRIHMTIMWTPTFAESYWNSELSGKHLNAGLLASFTTEVVRRYASEVGRFAIGDEPDVSAFLAHSENLATDMANYDRMYLAGYHAIEATDPAAEVIAGEITGINIFPWLHNVAALPSSGVGIHPYRLTNKTSEFVAVVRPVPLLVTEDAIPASDPHQLARDYEREQLAREGGARSFIFYQLARADSNERFWWNTGIE